MGVERAVIPVDDLGAAIERFEAEGYRLVTISPADAPRIADLDGPDRLVRLDATATEAAVITVEPRRSSSLISSRARDLPGCRC